MESYGDQAMYLAESALEWVVYTLNSDPDCNNLISPDQQALDTLAGNRSEQVISENG